MENHNLLFPTQPTDTIKTLLFHVDPAALPRFDDLLQTGFVVRTLTGLSIRAYLSGQLGLPDRYIDTKVTTVFLDGKPVDNIDTAAAGEGSTLALSSAMPGLVGATMRRESFYASLRNTIAYRGSEAHGLPAEGLLRVKLFNLLLPDLGPVFLERGIYLPVPEIARFLTRQSASFFAALKNITLGGNMLRISSLTRPNWAGADEWICVVVMTRKDIKSGDRQNHGDHDKAFCHPEKRAV